MSWSTQHECTKECCFLVDVLQVVWDLFHFQTPIKLQCNSSTDYSPCPSAVCLWKFVLNTKISPVIVTRAALGTGGDRVTHLVRKLAGWGCPSYKDKKSYSSSTAKDWKTMWILLRSSATITHVQFAPLGYPCGKPGLSIVPFLPFNVPPQVKMKPEGRTEWKKYILDYWHDLNSWITTNYSN